MSERTQPAVDRIMKGAIASASFFGRPVKAPEIPMERMAKLATAAVQDIQNLGLNDADSLTLASLVLAGVMHAVVPEAGWSRYTASLPAMLTRACRLLSGRPA